jgi:hypothetical protein
MKIIVYQKGGLGNQLYQYYLAKYLSKEYNAELICDITFYKFDSFIGNTHREFELNKIFSNIYYRTSIFYFIINYFAQKFMINNFRSFFLTDNNFNSNINNLIKKDTKYLILNGYFQNNRDILKYIEQIFILKTNFLNIYNKIDYKTSLCIHIRKGDYLNLQNIYSNLSSSYYFKGINYLNNKYNLHHTIYIFTDDLNWVNFNILNNNNYSFKIISTKSTIEDFQLLSTFNKVILSNSTFSLWSTYITLEDKIDVIAPKNWYVDDLKNIDFIKNNIPKSFILF